MSTTFLATPPVAIGGHKSAPAPVKPSSHILVAEDNLTIRQLYTQILMHAGYRVDTAENGQAAWNALASAHYDLLITDNNMPELSGVELVKKMRSAQIDLPVIMASGTAPANLDGLHLAAILNKPILLNRLVQTVDETLHWSTKAVHQLQRPSGSCFNPPPPDGVSN